MLSSIKHNYKEKKDDPEKPMINRFALHANSIRFAFNQKEISVNAPYPKDFKVFLKLLEKYDT